MWKELKEIYAYREMIFSLVRKDLRGRYKGSVLGFLWTFINPLLQLCVYTLVFSVIMKSGIEQYYLFLFVALIPWMFFASSLQGGSACILAQKDMVKKIYFPREVMPIAYVTSAFVNMLFCFIVIFAVLIVSGRGINLIALIALPVVMVVEYILCLGIALLASALTVYFRDLEYILGIVAMSWQYMTPVMYESNRVPEQYMFIWNLNPMTPVIEAYRAILFEGRFPELSTLLWAFALGITIMIIGAVVFSKLQKGFAEEF